MLRYLQFTARRKCNDTETGDVKTGKENCNSRKDRKCPDIIPRVREIINGDPENSMHTLTKKTYYKKCFSLSTVL